MKNKFTFSGFNGMAVINGVLTPIKATSVTMDAKGHFHYKTDKGEFTDIVLYEGQKDFERDNPKEYSVCLRTNNILVEEVLEEDGSTKMRMKVWRMVDGEPKEEWVDANFSMSQYTASVILPPDCYGTRTSCLANETYRYIDEEGNVKEKDGIGKRLRLTDEQKAYVENNFIPVLDKMREMGIGVTYSSCYDRLCAFNYDNDVEIDYLDGRFDKIPYVTADSFYKIRNSTIFEIGEEAVFFDKNDMK